MRKLLVVLPTTTQLLVVPNTYSFSGLDIGILPLLIIIFNNVGANIDYYCSMRFNMRFLEILAYRFKIVKMRIV